jgi:hypothetical protein
MDHSPKPGEITSRFEKLLVALAADRVDFAVVGGLAVIFNGYPRLRHLETGGVRIPYLAPEDLIFLKQGSWRDKDKLDVQAMREIIAREART